MSASFGWEKELKLPTFSTHLPTIDVRAEYESTEISGRLECQDILISVDDKGEKPSITSYVGHTASPYKRVINQLSWRSLCSAAHNQRCGRAAMRWYLLKFDLP